MASRLNVQAAGRSSHQAEEASKVVLQTLWAAASKRLDACVRLSSLLCNESLMGQQIKSVARGSVERNPGEQGDRLITLLASRAPRLYYHCSLKASTAPQQAVADSGHAGTALKLCATQWHVQWLTMQVVGDSAYSLFLHAGARAAEDAGTVPATAAFACNTRTASSRRCMAADTVKMAVGVGVSTAVDESN